MIYLAQTFWLPLVLTLIGGAVWGLVGPARPAGRATSLGIDAVWLLVAAAAVASVLKWVPGRPGLWLDTALLFTIAYLAGCILGGLMRAAGRVEEPVTEAAAAAPAPAAPGDAIAAIETAAKSLTGAAAAADAMTRGTKPEGLVAPRANGSDDLEVIRGIGPENAARLHALGIWHFDQIAAWSEKEALWVGGYLAFPGRIEREDWIGQAKVLAAGGTLEQYDAGKGAST